MPPETAATQPRHLKIISALMTEKQREKRSRGGGCVLRDTIFIIIIAVGKLEKDAECPKWYPLDLLVKLVLQ